MDIREFSKELLSVFPLIHAKLLKGQPAILKKGKITFSQMVVLELLSTKGESRMGEVSNALGVTKSAVTGLTDRLIKSGLLKRARLKQDRRIVKIHLTPKGRGIANRLKDYKLKMICRLFESITQKERSRYLAILKKIQKNIGKEGSKD